MKQKRHTTEEIIRIIREAASDKDLEAVCRQHNISAASFYRWKKKYGGMKLKDAPASTGNWRRRTANSSRCSPTAC